MTPQPSTSKDTSVAIGRLCVGGDWACAHGDFGTLRYIAQQLAERCPAAMHRELVELASACYRDLDRAAELWVHARKHLHRSARI